MHLITVIKMKGTSVKNAKETLIAEYLDIFCGEGKRFDYYDSYIIHIKQNSSTFTQYCNQYNVRTLKQLERALIGLYNNSMRHEQEELAKILLRLTLMKHMSLQEAPLYINHHYKEISDLANRILKDKIILEPFKTINTPEQFVEAFISLLKAGIGEVKECLDSMSVLENLLDQPTDESVTFESYEAHFIDITRHTKGKNVYYFEVSRHF